jgi:hypothetical protein
MNNATRLSFSPRLAPREGYLGSPRMAKPSHVRSVKSFDNSQELNSSSGAECAPRENVAVIASCGGGGSPSFFCINASRRFEE